MNPSTDIRPARTSDHPVLVKAIQTWWEESRTPEQARMLSLLLPRLFLQHFASSSLVAEDEAGVRAFLVGFFSPDHPEQAYIHFVGVDPHCRGQGLARRLYTTFFDHAIAAGRCEVHAITSPQNTGSIAFHKALEFTVDGEDKGISVHSDYDGPGEDRVAFRRSLIHSVPRGT
ncbi:GNAT family N-acetyltransferase [Sinorhizobium sp. 7-81]|uniref:GNAT family N-acetyltransferase n=1 Tax=unclassified Sinorhizobium TaxID=2613772 RepID=UPI0024C242AF|nr:MULTISPECIES: GNAT family N-acetyltransferase [unclassified Sinorhizobium]MDK1389788.1 GNAT family N-acetyltransferase [Sinorhizobium sp. 7-81]MDK1493687.1 GNAT family N-acetyltransferase [Sinorhizobium sp. 8-89]